MNEYTNYEAPAIVYEGDGNAKRSTKSRRAVR